MSFERRCWKSGFEKGVDDGNGWAQDGIDEEARAGPTYDINTEC